ncbi:AAEL000037-PA [Aedes aegypti]|uniref:CLIP domain-containing serine protease n=1 Tax=Aedes aegypti TaxID=7159 RepID=Q0C799_AEDAE|nr:AAEL000037-PA [Aedes aegypti]
MGTTMQRTLLASILIIVTLSISPGHALNENDPCIDPDGEAGHCIYLRECDPLVKILQKGNYSPQERNFIMRSRCGLTVDRKNLVCCKGTVDEGLPEPPKCGVNFSNRIHGGQQTEMDEFPWTALIHYRKPSGQTGFHCGGSLINSRYVITAAHCIQAIPRNWNVIGVRLGEWDLSRERDCDSDNVTCTDAPVDMGVEQIVVHEDYDPQSKAQHNDIALIRFTRDVHMSMYISPICLPLKEPQRSRNHVGSNGYAAGWGNTESGSASTVKLKVQLEVKDFRECAGSYQRAGINLLDTQLCAGGVKGQDTCSGDSGGPFTKLDRSSNYLLGIVSFGPTKCGTAGVPGIYTNVAKYVDWIRKNVRS